MPTGYPHGGIEKLMEIPRENIFRILPEFLRDRQLIITHFLCEKIRWIMINIDTYLMRLVICCCMLQSGVVSDNLFPLEINNT